MCKALTVAHHKRKRPKHRRGGCLLCKPQKLTANAKGERRRSRRISLQHERAADHETEAIAAERIRSGAADHKEDGAKALERLGIEYRYGDSNPGFRTENCLCEAVCGRFVPVASKEISPVPSSSVESGTYSGTRF
jgi:hypothetical protein